MCSSFFPKTTFLFLTLLIQMYGVISHSSIDADHHALMEIKSKIIDHRGVLESWNDSIPLCMWQGVTCGRRHQRVTSLNLRDNGLVGSLSPYIGNLSFLIYMNFSNNQLHGSIPPEIGRLSRLQVLLLRKNLFTGEIPVNISSCSKLSVISLSNNMLSGKIPKSFSSMLMLKYLVLGKNKLTGGIPPSIGNLTSLEVLGLYSCPLGGVIPDTFSQLKNLQQIYLMDNGLVGPNPLFLFNYSHLELVNIVENQLLGSLPSNLCLSQPHLRKLYLEINYLSGIFPPSISNCSELEMFDVGDNFFEGEINIDFGKLQNLRHLSIGRSSWGIHGRHLDGMKYFDSLSNCSYLEVLQIGEVDLRRGIPDSLGNLTKLSVLALESNYMLGGLPSSIGNLFSLTKLSLLENNFTGMIPESIGKLQNLGVLIIEGNSFSGIIPRSIGNMSSLTKVYLRINKLEGSIPSTIGKCKNLLLLILSENNLGGSIPKELFQVSSLSIGLDLSRNNLSGALPKEIGSLKNLGILDLSDNRLSGELPSGFSSYVSLQTLNLSGNFFHGSMPVSLSSLRGLEYVDVSRNNFSGHIPTYLQQLVLKRLDLSYNNFEGEVHVKGVFANTSAISVVGNPRLCGGVPELRLPTCRTTTSRKLSLRVVLAISLSSTVVGLALLSFVLFHCCRKKREKPSDSLLTESFEKISYGRLFKATEGFSAANLIGTGGFGLVYKGVLDEIGLTVAIKVLNLQHRGGSRSFMAECEALRNIRHRNLVKVITSCSSIDFQGNDFRALVYDFMPNGSLETWLHSSMTIDHLHHDDQLPQLNLVQRISIAKDVAYALDYLHYRCGNVVIHRDLKPSNILLDADMVAHVGDFGLAKILSLDELPDANKSSSSHVKGTIGYAPPEYGVGNEVSTGGDIYSYGILFALAGGFVLQIVDPKLLHDDVKEECLVSLLKIGVQCSSEAPQDRMDIGTGLEEGWYDGGSITFAVLLVPADGLLIRGHSLSIDESSMTRECKIVTQRTVMDLSNLSMERPVLAKQLMVHRLSACETMGSATTICSDKAGTLTLNQDGACIEVSGSPTEKAVLQWGVKVIYSICNGKDSGKFSGLIVDSDMHNVGRFLNRLLGLPPGIQNRLFELFVSILGHLPQNAHLDGIVDMKANTIDLQRLYAVYYSYLHTGRLHLHYLVRSKETCLVLLLMGFMNLRENGLEEGTLFWQSKGQPRAQHVAEISRKYVWLVLYIYIHKRIFCGRRHQRVTALDLSGKHLVGSLSPYIGNLSYLRYMNFNNNQLHGSIPPEIGRLSRLQLISLRKNSFTGEIPVNISSCSKLQYINLCINMLSGKLPNIFSSMLMLKNLCLTENNLTGGIPPFLGNVTSLELLALAGSPLGGNIPNSFSQLKNLQYLGLGESNLVGSFPLSIFNLSKLQDLSFPGNQLLGHLPSNLCSNQPHLQKLLFDNNHFTGILPPSISNCSELEYIDVSGNNFEGEIDIDFGKLQYLIWLSIGHDLSSLERGNLGGMKYFDSLYNCSNLETMQIGGVQLRRELPNSFGNLTKLSYLMLQSSYISGSLPSSIGNLVSLTGLFLAGNNFTGMIPESIGMLGDLGYLELNVNNFSETIPESIGNLSSLAEVDLGINKLEGTIPSTIGKCKNLLHLSLHENKLSGVVPKELFQLSSLSISLDLSGNNLSGVLPQEIGNLTNLGSLDLSRNHLSGELPSAFSSCISLEFLNLSGNFFHGSIPLSFTSLRGLQYVDVSRNNFSGHIPTYLQQIPLKRLDLSDNNFEGEVFVKGVFANTSTISVNGNPRLCGGVPELHLPICRTKSSRKLSLRVVVAISLSSTVAGLALVSIVLFRCCKKKKGIPADSILSKSFEKISYGRLFKATEGFSAANLIGTGGFGSVYKGVLDENGLTVAIKVLNLQHRGGFRSFMAECEALKNIRHRNLVKVITSCSSINFQGNDFKALVYDFMPNGSLETWLHSTMIEDHMPHDQMHQLDLVQRISIAKDVAYALDYLHYRCGNVVVHRDLKPSNILLDADMVAHVGDFGLAKSFHLPNFLMQTRVAQVMSKEQLDMHHQMLTGKKPVDPMFHEGLSLHSYATSALAGGFVLQIVDPKLLRRDDVKEKCLISLLKIGVQCSCESPHDRMDISTVIHELLSVTVATTS
ncbi:hypothetical protein OSB04_027705 [Centaurea solstitialis]|uniref:non-specific serine/threonine protein kinase n=1 Tax=Centaurea solstitialis TaxID=347529 RepID=A0AA38SE41_9ASTR|nr:hypothetical protein OSB04_027705 [Centaurea solstitialis]